VKLALAAGIALLVVAIVAVMSHSPPSLAGTNSVPAREPVASTNGRTSSCQRASLPRETTGIRISLASVAGPRLSVGVYSQSRSVTHGERSAGWGVWANVVVPVKPLAHTLPHALICVAVAQAPAPVKVLGEVIRPAPHGKLGLQDVRLRFEYLRAGPKSWWSLAYSVARRMGFGRAPSGLWAAFLALVSIVAVIVLAARLVAEELR
jgi:hypothetical protein